MHRKSEKNAHATANKSEIWNLHLTHNTIKREEKKVSTHSIQLIIGDEMVRRTQRHNTRLR